MDYNFEQLVIAPAYVKGNTLDHVLTVIVTSAVTFQLTLTYYTLPSLITLSSPFLLTNHHI